MARKHRDVMRMLIADIVSGVRPAGEMLPRAGGLADEFEVSRGVARETIRAMEERGLISVKHGKGATVNEPAEGDVLDPDVRGAGLAAERATKRNIEQLTAALRRMEETAARPESQAAEERFHESDIAFHQT